MDPGPISACGEWFVGRSDVDASSGLLEHEVTPFDKIRAVWTTAVVLASMQKHSAQLHKSMAKLMNPACSPPELPPPHELAALRAIVEGTAHSTGEEFFQTLVQHLSQAVDARYAFIAE